MKKTCLFSSMFLTIILNFSVSAFADAIPLTNGVKANISNKQLNSSSVICHGATINYYIENNGKYKTVITIEGDTPVQIQGQELAKFLTLCNQINSKNINDRKEVTYDNTRYFK